MTGAKDAAGHANPIAERFEAERGRLRGVAYRLLGSLDEADDAIQEAWLRLERTNADEIVSLSGWLTTVVSRIALDTLRARRSRNEAPFEQNEVEVEAALGRTGNRDPREEVILAEGVGMALLAVLDRLGPAERIAFVLHDLFGVGFDAVAQILQRSPAAARQIASRARRRVRGGADVAPDLARQKAIVAAFASAAREGRFDDLLTLLHPDVELKVDAALLPVGAPTTFRGAAFVAKRALAGVTGISALAVLNGRPAIVASSPDQPRRVLLFTIAGGLIHGIEVAADPGVDATNKVGLR